MIGKVTILRPTPDAMTSILFKGPSQAEATRPEITLEPSATAIFAVPRIHYIELVSILALCIFLCGVLYFCRRSLSHRKKPSNMGHAAQVGEHRMQQKGPIDSAFDSLSGPTKSYRHVMTNRSDESAHLVKVPQLTRKWEDLPRAEVKHSTVYGNIDLAQTVGKEIPGETAAGPWEPRRSGRARKPTRRFEESWYNADLQVLASALGGSL